MSSFFFFNDTATTEIYTLSLHDALPIWRRLLALLPEARTRGAGRGPLLAFARSEEHTSELQSRSDLVCRLLLEKKKKPTLYACTHENSFRSRRLNAQPSHNSASGLQYRF